MLFFRSQNDAAVVAERAFFIQKYPFASLLIPSYPLSCPPSPPPQSSFFIPPIAPDPVLPSSASVLFISYVLLPFCLSADLLFLFPPYYLLSPTPIEVCLSLIITALIRWLTELLKNPKYIVDDVMVDFLSITKDVRRLPHSADLG